MKYAILNTISYADIHNYPLTKTEIVRYLWKRTASNHCIDTKLQTLIDEKKIKETSGFYTLPNRTELVSLRQQKNKYLEQKRHIAKQAIKKITWVPFLQAVYLCNTVASGTAKKTSDIDVFIITKDAHIWTTRLCITLALSLLHNRRTKTAIENKICLSFYTTEKHLGLEKIAIQQPDIYLIHWIKHLLPLYDPKQLYQSMQKANKWTQKFLPNATDKSIIPRYQITPSHLSQIIQTFTEEILNTKMGELAENVARTTQKKHMKKNVTSVQHKSDSRVIISDHMLKFHENDRRQSYKQKWQDRYNTIAT